MDENMYSFEVPYDQGDYEYNAPDDESLYDSVDVYGPNGKPTRTLVLWYAKKGVCDREGPNREYRGTTNYFYGYTDVLLNCNETNAFIQWNVPTYIQHDAPSKWLELTLVINGKTCTLTATDQQPMFKKALEECGNPYECQSDQEVQECIEDIVTWMATYGNFQRYSKAIYNAFGL